MRCIWVRSNELCKKIGVLFLLESTFQLSENLLDMKDFFFSQGFLFYLKIGSTVSHEEMHSRYNY